MGHRPQRSCVCGLGLPPPLPEASRRLRKRGARAGYCGGLGSRPYAKSWPGGGLAQLGPRSPSVSRSEQRKQSRGPKP